MKTVQVVGMILLAFSVTARADMIEDFESYPLHTWPAPGWVADGNGDTDPTNNRIELDPTDGTNKVLKLYGSVVGIWGAIAYYPQVFPDDFVMEVSIYNGAEDVGGANGWRGAITMKTGTSWTGPPNSWRTLIWLRGDGTIHAVDGIPIGTYSTEQWYDFAIHYHRNAQEVTLDYWLDHVYLGQLISPIWSQSVESGFDHFEIDAGHGTVYYDNIRVYSAGNPTPVPVPGAFLLGGIGLSYAGWLLRRRTL